MVSWLRSEAHRALQTFLFSHSPQSSFLKPHFSLVSLLYDRNICALPPWPTITIATGKVESRSSQFVMSWRCWLLISWTVESEAGYKPHEIPQMCIATLPVPKHCCIPYLEFFISLHWVLELRSSLILVRTGPAVIGHLFSLKDNPNQVISEAR